MVNEETVCRFWAKVEKGESCWIWKGSKRNKGYGAFVWANSCGTVIQGRAHRFSYEIHKGVIPKGMFVLHKCDEPSCVNPEHLFIGSNQDNVDDMMKKGRHVKGGTYSKGKYPKGENHHNSKLTEKKVNEIRTDKQNMSYSALSKKYKIAVGHLHRIITKKAWK